MEITYKIIRWRIILVYIFAVISVLVTGLCLFLSIIERDSKWLIAGAMALMTFLVFSFFVEKKVIIRADRIIRVGLFGNKATMFLNDIAGYRLKRVPKNPNSLMLVLVSIGDKKLPIRWFQLNEGKEILAWAQQNFRNLE
jgi:hypothetical protein